MPFVGRKSRPRPEGQHRKPRRIHPRCPEPWKKLRKHQVRSHGSIPQSPNPSRLGSYRSRLPIHLRWDWLASGTPWRASASYFYECVYKCRLQGVTSGIGLGFRSNSFVLSLKFICVFTQMDFGSIQNVVEVSELRNSNENVLTGRKSELRPEGQHRAPDDSSLFFA